MTHLASEGKLSNLETFFSSCYFTLYIFSAQSDVGHSSGHSASSGDLISGNYKKDAADALSTWNPFEDTTPFSQAVTEEEDLFGAEFDKIRQEGENDSLYIIEFIFIELMFLGTKSLERLEHQTIPEDPFQAPFSLRQQRALKKNGSLEVEGKICM